METDEFVDALLELGRSGNLQAVTNLPGAGVHQKVCNMTSRFRGQVLERIATLSVEDRVALVKALAMYENSVGGLGSVTAVPYVMRLFGDAIEIGYQTFQWIVDNTRSLWYYKDRAVDFIEPELSAMQRKAAQEEVELKNYERAAPARAKRVERATSNLYNAVRRGDIKAVQALLSIGADPETLAPNGESLISYAQSLGRRDIAFQLTVHLKNKN